MSDLLASPAFAKLVVHFALHGEEPKHLRAIQRHTGLSMSSLSRELRRLEDHGLIARRREGSRVRYWNRHDHPGWKSLRQLIRDFGDPAEVLAEAFGGVEGIEAAFIFGSFARGDYREDSDLDVLVLGERLESARLGRKAAEASLLLGRPVEIKAYTREKLDRQLQAGNPVLRRIVAGPKRWIVGDERRLGRAA